MLIPSTRPLWVASLHASFDKMQHQAKREQLRQDGAPVFIAAFKVLTTNKTVTN